MPYVNAVILEGEAVAVVVGARTPEIGMGNEVEVPGSAPGGMVSRSGTGAGL
jgi:hypothetical protein